ncbi:TetR family transcriptional regulator [Flavobacterium sp. NG2]|uniref:TetR/AcrR family transcriptional regulator n=1 Tax=Flavobacterium sp. NG2 TaxID=3097547 RepID=UPI002A7FD4A8|nr:TetR family transcriptional regulator [Flavobacterium sp. NG2]WPR71003.1 TetR family transcriptional regulator [Flavobacterium sp. NG2]
MSLNTDFNEKQIEILLVAETLFADNGFEGTSIRTIAKEAKINVAMVSYYFGSKDKLLEALVVYRTKDLRFEMAHLSTENLDPIEKIKKVIDLYINRINCNKGIFRIIHFELTKGKESSKIKALDEIRYANLLSLTSIIEEGQSKGIFRKDVIIPLIPPTILGTFFHFHINKMYFQEILNLKTEESFDNYIKTTLSKHIQQTINALLTYDIAH